MTNKEEQEKAFVYRWHIEPTNKYYIGSHNGKKIYYTHSSNDKEFCSYVPNSRSSVAERREFLANMPEGITREIITYGTYEKMLTLERTLQLHAKEHCWEEYYNDNVCDGVYYGFGSGEDNYISSIPPENHPSYTHGRTVGWSKDPKIAASYAKERYDNMPPEEKEKYLKERREASRARRAKMTPEERKSSDKERNDKKWAKMTPEKKEERNRKQRVKRAKNKKETGYAHGHSYAKKKVKKIDKQRAKMIVEKNADRTAFFESWQEALWSST